MLYQDKDWLYEKYVVQELSTVEIAKAYREQENKWCDPNTISRWLKKHQISVRTLTEAQQLRHEQAGTAKVKIKAKKVAKKVDSAESKSKSKTQSKKTPRAKTVKPKAKTGKKKP
jgi:hypothetical protein